MKKRGLETKNCQYISNIVTLNFQSRIVEVKYFLSSAVPKIFANACAGAGDPKIPPESPPMIRCTLPKYLPAILSRILPEIPQ